MLYRVLYWEFNQTPRKAQTNPLLHVAHYIQEIYLLKDVVKFILKMYMTFNTDENAHQKFEKDYYLVF